MKKWYLQTWFIAILFALWPFFLPFIAGIVLLIIKYSRKFNYNAEVLKNAELKVIRQYEEVKSEADKYSEEQRAEADLYSEETKSEADKYSEEQRAEADLYSKDLKFDAYKYSEDLKLNADEYSVNKKKEADEYFINKKSEADKIINSIENKYDSLKKRNADLNKIIKELRNELSCLEKEAIIAYVATSIDDSITSEECKNMLSVLRLKQNELIKSQEAVNITSAQPKSVTNNNIKQILRCFNVETDNIISSVTATNIDICRNKLQKTFETLNRIYKTDGVALQYNILESKFEELNLVYNYEKKKAQEKEEQKAIKEQMLEEEKVRREIEREKLKIEKEEAQFSNEITKLMGYLQKAGDIEKQLYVDKIRELEDKLSTLSKDKENVLEREQNTRAGFVYVISNIGAFGENVFKIGMTRRLEPMDRISELSGASVPFEFDVHAMIFSHDAPELENILHTSFRKYQVNKVNNRKEFFRVPLQEIESLVKEKHNATVTFTLAARAEQYRETLKIEEMSAVS